VQSLDAYDTFFVATLWLPVMVSAFATLLLKAVPRGAGALHRGCTLPSCSRL
jgi:hypothetical protein